MSVVERVNKLTPAKDEVTNIICYDELGEEPTSRYDTLHDSDEFIFIDPKWTPTQISEFIAVKVWGLDDNNMCYDEDDNMTLGYKVVDAHQANNVLTIQTRSDRGHLGLTIIIW